MTELEHQYEDDLTEEEALGTSLAISGYSGELVDHDHSRLAGSWSSEVTVEEVRENGLLIFVPHMVSEAHDRGDDHDLTAEFSAAKNTVECAQASPLERP